MSLNTGEVLLFILQHQVGAAHGKQVSEGAFSVTHHTRLTPQLLWFVFFVLRKYRQMLSTWHWNRAVNIRYLVVSKLDGRKTFQEHCIFLATPSSLHN